MDNELKQHLDGMEARIMERVGGQIAGVETRMEGMEARIMERVGGQIAGVETRMEGMEARIMERMDGRIDASEQRLKAHTSQECEKVETKLLTEFHKWGRTSDMRTREAIRHADTLEERMLALEDRISAIERKPTA